MSICIQCPLYKLTWLGNVLGPICNPDLAVDIKTGEVVDSKKAKGDNFVSGCACRLEAKTRVRDVKCPINKW